MPLTHSETLGELATALATAQGDPHAEAVPVRAITRALRPIDRSSGRTVLQRFWACVAFGSSECWYWTGHLDEFGYGRAGQRVLGEVKAHRFAYRLFKGDIAAGLEVMHSCDVRCCVNPDHLSLGTHAENVADMVRKGRQSSRPMRGHKNGQAKLAPEQVAEIRGLKHGGGISQAEIARRFNVSPMAVSRIVRGESW